MTKTELDWSFDVIPAEDDGGPPPAREPAAPVPDAARPKRRRRRAWWWLLASVPALLLVGAGGTYVFQRVGWQRLVAQVAHEVLTEDAYARAGDVAMVRSFLSEDDAEWSALRAAEARYGLAVTLPAGHMRPLDEPPRIESVDPLVGQVFEARVLRAFADPAGQVYHLRYAQRYRNLGPGLWERLPTDQAALALQGRWNGQRLVAVFPMEDWPWLEPVLPRVEGWLAQACAAWHCLDNMQVSLTLTGRPGELRPVRGASFELEAGPPTTPIIFGLGPHRPLYPARLVLPSPQVAGQPVEPVASEALARALGVQALAHMALQVSGLSQDGPDFYLEALVARAEARLGLSPALAYVPAPDAYVPPPGLWSRGLAGRAVDLPPGLTYRLQALAFLNYALDGQPPEVDGALLRGLGRQSGLVPWLTAALGADAADLPAAWTAHVTAAAVPASPLAWQQLDGLTYTCEDGAWLIRGRGLAALPSGADEQTAIASSVSADGRYVASLRFSPVNGLGRLRVLEVDTGRAEVAAQARFVTLLGWSADHHLLFLQNDVALASSRGVRLMRYDPETGVSRPVIPNAIRPLGLATGGASEANWSPDRAAVALTVNTDPTGGSAQWRAALVPVLVGDGTPRPEDLAEDSYAPILSPDGLQAAYGRDTIGWPVLEVHGLGTPAALRLATAGDVALPAGEGRLLPERLLPMAWSPDGAELLFMATGEAYGSRLYRIGTDGQGLAFVAGAAEAGWVMPLGFSADGRYLGYFEASLSDPAARLQVLDRQTGEVTDLAAFPGSVSWSTHGHLLALAVEEGAYVLDPVTGDRRWLAFQTCQRVSW